MTEPSRSSGRRVTSPRLSRERPHPHHCLIGQRSRVGDVVAQPDVRGAKWSSRQAWSAPGDGRVGCSAPSRLWRDVVVEVEDVVRARIAAWSRAAVRSSMLRPADAVSHRGDPVSLLTRLQRLAGGHRSAYARDAEPVVGRQPCSPWIGGKVAYERGRGRRAAARAGARVGADRVGVGRGSLGARHGCGDRGAGRDWQDGLAHGRADGSRKRRHARASVAGCRPGARFRLGIVRQLFEPRAGRGLEPSAPICCKLPGVAAGLLASSWRPVEGAPSSGVDSSFAILHGLYWLCATWPPTARFAWWSTTRTGRTPRPCVTWPSCSRVSKSWTPRSWSRPAPGCGHGCRAARHGDDRCLR